MNTIDRSLSLLTVLLISSLGLSAASGHFVWIAKDAKSGETRIFFGEGPKPDQKQFLKGIAKINSWTLRGKKFVVSTVSEKTEGDRGWFVSEEQGKTKQGNEVIGDVAYGVFSRGETAMYLHYSAKYAALQSGGKLNAQASKLLPLDIQASIIKGKVRLSVVFLGKPVANCHVVVVDPTGLHMDAITNAQGELVLFAQDGRYLIRAKKVNAKKGEAKGEKFDETRNYCTLVLDVRGASTATAGKSDPDDKKNKRAKDETSSKNRKYPDIPRGLTSFGGAVAKNKLYIYGGHTGKAHSYYESGQNKTLYELDLANPSGWKKAATGLGLQGLAMVAHKGKIYRLGGFHAHNKEGEKQDLRSVAEFAVFDSANHSWKQLAPMPEGRSSFDAVVHGDAIYVVGGWTMKGSQGKQWCETAIRFDLSVKNGEWQELSTPPFKRRALSVGFQGNHLVAIGGMQDKGGPTKKVALYDLKSKSWREGPELPGKGAMEGFGSSCFNIGGDLIVSTYGGNVYRLEKDLSRWIPVTKLEDGRFFHRLLPLSKNDFILVGGANMDTGKFYHLEVISKK